MVSPSCVIQFASSPTFGCCGCYGRLRGATCSIYGVVVLVDFDGWTLTGILLALLPIQTLFVGGAYRFCCKFGQCDDEKPGWIGG